MAPLIVNLVMTPYVIHGLGIAVFGLYILATSISDFLGTFDGWPLLVLAALLRRLRRARRPPIRDPAVFQPDRRGLGSRPRHGRHSVRDRARHDGGLHIPQDLRGEGTFLLRVLGIVIALELMRGVFAAILNSRQRFATSSLTTIAQYGVYSVGVILTVSQGWGLRASDSPSSPRR